MRWVFEEVVQVSAVTVAIEFTHETNEPAALCSHLSAGHIHRIIIKAMRSEKITRPIKVSETNNSGTDSEILRLRMHTYLCHGYVPFPVCFNVPTCLPLWSLSQATSALHLKITKLYWKTTGGRAGFYFCSYSISLLLYTSSLSVA